MTDITGRADEPPYLRIAAEIRRRIGEGELAPGDRVPSTRRIAAEWGVALATATKALTHLRLEGTVETQPRVGTVVATPSPPGTAPRRRRPAPLPGAGTTASAGPGPAEQELTLDRIVSTAIGIADTEGLGALSMRGVATASVSPPCRPTGTSPARTTSSC